MPEPYVIPQSLETDQSFQLVVATAHRLNQFGEPYEARQYFRELKTALEASELGKVNQSLAEAYGHVIAYLQFLILPSLDDRELVALFRQHLLEGIQTDIDLKTRVELLFLTRFDDLLDRSLRRLLIKTIAENDQRIGQRSITIRSLAGSQPPSVRCWILDFLENAASRNTPTALDVATFFTQSVNVRGLMPPEQDLLRQVLNLYLFILAGPPSEAEYHYALTATRTRAVGVPRETAQDLRTLMLQSLFEQQAMEDAIYEAEKHVLGKTGYSFEHVVAEFKTGIANVNIPTATGAAFLLARSGDLRTLLSRDGDFVRLMDTEVLPAMVASLRSRRSGLSQSAVIDDFHRQPNRPVYLKAFLEYVLTAACGGNVEEAARFGIRIESFLYRAGYYELVGMAYFDESAKKYRWADVGLDSQGVPTLIG